jgi:hypothetical protein
MFHFRNDQVYFYIDEYWLTKIEKLLKRQSFNSDTINEETLRLR